MTMTEEQLTNAMVVEVRHRIPALALALLGDQMTLMRHIRGRAHAVFETAGGCNLRMASMAYDHCIYYLQSRIYGIYFNRADTLGCPPSILERISGYKESALEAERVLGKLFLINNSLRRTLPKHFIDILGAELMNPDIDRPNEPTLAETIAGITTPAHYWPQDLIVKVISLPSDMAADQLLRDAFINLIENLATDISSFRTDRQLRPSTIGEDVLEFESNNSGITVYAPEYQNKPVLRMLRQIQNRFMAGRSMKQLGTDPFALIAFEPNLTRTDVVDAWLIPSFYIASLPSHLGRKDVRSPAVAGDFSNNLYSFDLEGEIIQSDLVTKVASSIYQLTGLEEGHPLESVDTWPTLLKQLLPNGYTDVQTASKRGYSEVINRAE